jgi:hypothetical protein
VVFIPWVINDMLAKDAQQDGLSFGIYLCY